MSEANGTNESGQQGRAKRKVVLRLVIAAVVFAALAGAWVWLGSEAGRTEFPLKEVPIPDEVSPAVMYQGCHTQPSEEVKRYPEFKSDKPLFGRFAVGGYDSAEKRGGTFFFAIDESAGPGTGYDTIYMDANGNLDLTDDKPAKSRPAVGRPTSGESFFSSIIIPSGGEGGEDIAIAPRMTGFGDGSKGIRFLPATVRQGRVRIKGRLYTATLTRADNLLSGYDLPRTSLRLYRPESAIRIGGQTLWRISGEENLESTVRTVFLVRGMWHSFTTTAAGDVITVHPYKGDLGVIRVSHDGKTAGNLIMGGTLISESGSAISLRSTHISVDDIPSGETAIPVGEYAPDLIGVRVGQFRLTVASNHLRDEGEHDPSDYFLKVRKDSPCNVEIPAKVAVRWLESERTRAFAPGEVVGVYPSLETSDLLIEDVTFAPRSPSGALRMPARQLWPAITIQDSAGKTLATGTSVFNYSWTIPTDFTSRNGRETLTVTAKWDTKELFGVVTGTKGIVVESTGTGEEK